jgi:hypothetical protein
VLMIKFEDCYIGPRRESSAMLWKTMIFEREL